MKPWKHITFEQRKIINNLLSKKYRLIEIASLLDLDPTAISKEIKRNRILTKIGLVKDKVCKYTQRFPYCYNGCQKNIMLVLFLSINMMLLVLNTKLIDDW